MKLIDTLKIIQTNPIIITSIVKNENAYIMQYNNLAYSLFLHATK
jgi:hypothetical protein